MKNIKNWIPTAVVMIVILLALYYSGVMDSKLTIGIVVTTFSVLLFISALLTPSGDE